MTPELDVESIKFDETGLVPVVVQDAGDGVVLMLGYMNAWSLRRTIETGQAVFYSRSRKRLWRKGETSGNCLRVVSLAVDCDRDSILLRATPEGPTCHSGRRSCFTTTEDPASPVSHDLGGALDGLQRTIEERDRDRPPGSYTASLIGGGLLRAAQKVAEEGVEVALAAAADPARVVSESADLLYHLLVLWRVLDLDCQTVAEELTRRREAS